MMEDGRWKIEDGGLVGADRSPLVTYRSLPIDCRLPAIGRQSRSRITHHVSRFTHHASRITHHVSRIT
jgi:hypothetical protein